MAMIYSRRAHWISRPNAILLFGFAEQRQSLYRALRQRRDVTNPLNTLSSSCRRPRASSVRRLPIATAIATPQLVVQARDIFAPDLHIDTLKVKARNSTMESWFLVSRSCKSEIDRFWQKAHAMTSIFIEGCHAGPSATRSTGAYGEQGRLAPFVVTIAVILLIVVTFLQWIDHLSRLGRVTETTRRVEETTLRAVEAWQTAPNLGGDPLQEKDRTPGQDNAAFVSDRVGYVQHVDSGAIPKIAEDLDCDVFSRRARRPLLTALFPGAKGEPSPK